jgi:hypothetical protein
MHLATEDTTTKHTFPAKWQADNSYVHTGLRLRQTTLAFVVNHGIDRLPESILACSAFLRPAYIDYDGFVTAHSIRIEWNNITVRPPRVGYEHGIHILSGDGNAEVHPMIEIDESGVVCVTPIQQGLLEDREPGAGDRFRDYIEAQFNDTVVCEPWTSVSVNLH